MDLLLLTIKKPHKSATTQTISRWIKKGLNAAGVDVSKFSAQSTRHASTSAALRLGVNINTIKESADWSVKTDTFNESVFFSKTCV